MDPFVNVLYVSILIVTKDVPSVHVVLSLGLYEYIQIQTYTFVNGDISKQNLPIRKQGTMLHVVLTQIYS